MSLIKRVVDSLVDLDSFAVSVVIDKKEFKENVLSDFRKRLDECLTKLNLAYLNVFIVPTIRKKLINSFIEKDVDLIVRAQSVNELLVRIQKALERRNAKSFIFFDSEANTLVSPTYGLFAGAFRREGLAYAKGGLGRSDRIIHASLSRSSLDYGIQLADLLVNALWNCVVHDITDLYEHLDKLLGDKGLAVLPKGIKICG